MSFRFSIVLATVAAIFCFTGCGGSTAPSLKGKVTLDGVPVTSGNIVFLPEQSDGRKAVAVIEDGNYVVPAEEGLLPGKYRVEVSWHKPTGKKIPSADPGMMMDETREAIPAKYTSDSTLMADLAPGEASKDFALTSK